MSADPRGDLATVRYAKDEADKAATDLRKRRAILIESIRFAHRRGASEVALARAAGVARSTIRAWLGK